MDNNELNQELLSSNELMKASDYNGWKDTLVAILTKHGKSPANVVNYYGQTVNQGEATLSTQIGTIRSDIINSSQALCHVPSITELDVGDFSKGSPTLLDTKTKIEAKLAEMNAICHHNANYSDYSDNDNVIPCQHYSDWPFCGSDDHTVIYFSHD